MGRPSSPRRSGVSLHKARRCIESHKDDHNHRTHLALSQSKEQLISRSFTLTMVHRTTSTATAPPLQLQSTSGRRKGSLTATAATKTTNSSRFSAEMNLSRDRYIAVYSCPFGRNGVLFNCAFVLALCVLILPLVQGDGSGNDYPTVFAIGEEDGMLETSQLIRKYGYPIEQHEVITADGYVLTLTRIPSNSIKTDASLPVLLVHAMFTSSADFLIIGPNNSLAYLLSDQGHDVWLLDHRGNRYSRSHISLSIDSREYWDFTWHEMGFYDLPATIDHILSVTGARRLHYIGVSQGTTVLFVLASTHPEYNDKIASMYALAPAAYIQNIRSPVFRWLAKNVATIYKIMNMVGIWHVFPYSKIRFQLLRVLCPACLQRNICVNLLEQMFGPNPSGTDRLAQHILGGHNPSGTWPKLLLHYAQLNRCGCFQQFSYERKEQNVAHYGQEHPPAYNLSAITIPVALFYAPNDWMVHPSNVVRLAKELPNVVSLTEVADPNFNHFDFLVAKRVRELVYDKILQELSGL